MSDSKNWRSIRSYGIILVRFIHDYPEYLMVCRKSTYCFVDFLLGKYSDKNVEYLKFMIKNMTYYERMAITTKTYEELWSDLYSNSRTPTGAFYEYVSQKFYKSRDIFIVLNSALPCKHRHPEWGFPKGRPNQSEDPFDCASRELYEETRLNRSSYEIIREIFSRSFNQLLIALIANLPIGTNLVLEPLPITRRKDIFSSKSLIFIFTVSETRNPDEYISSTIAMSLISIVLEGLKFKSCSTSSGERTSGKVFDDFGAVTSSKGDEPIRLFFFKNLKNPFADDKCL